MARNIWNRLKSKTKGKGKTGSGSGSSGGSGEGSAGRDLPESRGLMSTSIHDDDEDLNEFM